MKDLFQAAGIPLETGILQTTLLNIDLFPFFKIITFLIALGTVSVMVHVLSSSVAQFSLLSLSFLFTEIAVFNWNQHVVKQNEGLVSGCWHSLGKQEYYKPLW
jgi:hypothetical protein